ncbi:hypothetical protein BofuT4_uP033230.1 [Botrytis cinerea T4]|uniref:Uncharacterized protein n=1 Tax=Botryotinia fuckeliana (strain T4) TaxID=999810 RepID=G2Y7V3_BOTF4|nr:hypothetical protein BofuT4_uP033230.1 [Botrytis cinerea T4]
MQGVQLALYLSSWEGTLISMRYMKENITTLANVGVRFIQPVLLVTRSALFHFTTSYSITDISELVLGLTCLMFTPPL